MSRKKLKPSRSFRARRGDIERWKEGKQKDAETGKLGQKFKRRMQP